MVKEVDDSVDEFQEAEHTDETSWLTQILDAVWNGIVLADSKWNSGEILLPTRR